jgi:uncharacterized membrane protein
MDDIARLAQAVIKFRKKQAPLVSEPRIADQAETASNRWDDVLSLGFAVACLMLILLAPSLTGASAADVGAHLLQEISPTR